MPVKTDRRCGGMGNDTWCDLGFTCTSEMRSVAGMHTVQGKLPHVAWHPSFGAVQGFHCKVKNDWTRGLLAELTPELTELCCPWLTAERVGCLLTVIASLICLKELCFQ